MVAEALEGTAAPMQVEEVSSADGKKVGQREPPEGVTKPFKIPRQVTAPKEGGREALRQKWTSLTQGWRDGAPSRLLKIIGQGRRSKIIGQNEDTDLRRASWVSDGTTRGVLLEAPWEMTIEDKAHLPSKSGTRVHCYSKSPY